MGSLSDPGRSRGALMARLDELERQVRDLQTRRSLPAASIGSGGLKVLDGGNITLEGGDVLINGGGRVISGDPDGAHAEMTDAGYRVVNEDGEVTIDLTITGDNQLLLRGSVVEDENEILLSQDGEISGKSLVVDAITLDGEDLGELLEGNDITDPEPSPGDQRNVYTAVWSQAYRSNNQPNNFVNGGGLTQGHYSGLNGNQRSLIGFPSSQIQSDLAGRTVTRVRVYLYYYHWYFNSGGTAVLGHHGHSSRPGSFSASATNVTRSGNWPKPGSRWVRYDHGMQAWATGVKKGIVLGPAPSGSNTYYGIARGHNQSSAPRLEIRSTA